MAKKAGGAYGLGLDKIIDIILAIIPITSIILGIVRRATTGHLLGAVLNFFLAPIFWVVDIVTVVLNDKLELLA